MLNISKLIAAGAVCAGLICAESIREQLNFKVTKYQICTPKMKSGAKPKKMLFLSDLHNTEYGKKNVHLLQAVKKARPDVILIGGDMLIGKEERLPDAALAFVEKLPQIAPVYYANGNHEQRMKENTKKYGNVFYVYRKELQEAGVHFLENESTVIDLDGWKVRLTGLELPMETYEKFKSYPVKKKDIVNLVGNIASEQNQDTDSVKSNPEECYEILLAHNPGYYNAYKAWGADLVLSGHLHGGVARIPGWRGVITPQAFLFPKYSGEMTEEDGQTIVVSRGLGMHTIKFRFFNTPELVELNIFNS